MLAIINVQRSNDKALDEVKEDFMIITKEEYTPNPTSLPKESR